MIRRLILMSLLLTICVQHPAYAAGDNKKAKWEQPGKKKKSKSKKPAPAPAPAAAAPAPTGLPVTSPPAATDPAAAAPAADPAAGTQALESQPVVMPNSQPGNDQFEKNPAEIKNMVCEVYGFLGQAEAALANSQDPASQASNRELVESRKRELKGIVRTYYQKTKQNIDPAAACPK